MSRPRRSDHRLGNGLPRRAQPVPRTAGRAGSRVAAFPRSRIRRHPPATGIRREAQRQPCAPGTSGLTTMGQPYTGGRDGEVGMPEGAQGRGGRRRRGCPRPSTRQRKERSGDRRGGCRACEASRTTYPAPVGGAVLARVRECKNRDADPCARAGSRARGGRSRWGCPRPSTRQRKERSGDRRGGCRACEASAVTIVDQPPTRVRTRSSCVPNRRSGPALVSHARSPPSDS